MSDKNQGGYSESARQQVSNLLAETLISAGCYIATRIPDAAKCCADCEERVKGYADACDKAAALIYEQTRNSHDNAATGFRESDALTARSFAGLLRGIITDIREGKPPVLADDEVDDLANLVEWLAGLGNEGLRSESGSSLPEAAASIGAQPRHPAALAATGQQPNPRVCEYCGCETMVIECLRCHKRRPHGEPPALSSPALDVTKLTAIAMNRIVSMCAQAYGEEMEGAPMELAALLEYYFDTINGSVDWTNDRASAEMEEAAIVDFLRKAMPGADDFESAQQRCPHCNDEGIVHNHQGDKLGPCDCNTVTLEAVDEVIGRELERFRQQGAFDGSTRHMLRTALYQAIAGSLSAQGAN